MKANPVSTDAQVNSQEMFATSFANHREQLKRMLALRMSPRLRSRVDVSDVVQQTYVDAWKRIAHYNRKPQFSLYVWLRQVAQQCLIDAHRHHMRIDKRSLRREVDRSTGYSAGSNSWLSQLVSGSATPSQLVQRMEDAQSVGKVLQSLPEMDRQILVLRHFEGLRNNEIAEILGLKPAAASNRYMRAIERLREAMSSTGSILPAETKRDKSE